MVEHFFHGKAARAEGSVDQGADYAGDAAILLVESLIHSLIAQSVISSAEALEIVTVAIDIRTDQGDGGAHSATRHRSLGILTNIAQSLSHDI